MSENECNGLTTAKYLAAEDVVVQNPRGEEGAAPDEATGRRRLLASTALFSIVFLLAAAVGIGYQVCLPLLVKKGSTLWDDVTKPLASMRERSPQRAMQKLLIKNHDDIMAEIQQRNKSNPVNPHLEKLTREGWTQPEWSVGNGGFQAAPFGS